MRLTELTRLADMTVMFPAALVILAWLLLSRSKTASCMWGISLLFVYGLVGASKVLFKGWGVGLQTLDISVISGQAMNATLILTVGLSLLARQYHAQLRWPAAALGQSIGWWFGIVCVTKNAHPLSEAIAGCMLGAIAACAFLYRIERIELRRLHWAAIACGLLLIGATTTITQFPVEKWLDQVAISISGEDKAIKHAGWRQN